MTQEQFENLGIEKELAKKAAEESKKELESYVAKDAYDTAEQQRKQLETSVTDYKTQLENLKASAGDNENLKQKIADLQAENQRKDNEYKNQLKELKLTNAIKLALGDSTQDGELVASLFDRSKLILSDDGKVTGLDEQLKTLKETKAFLFKPEKKPEGKKGFFPLGPGEQGEKGGEGKMTMKEAIAAKLNLNQEGKGE